VQCVRDGVLTATQCCAVLTCHLDVDGLRSAVTVSGRSLFRLRHALFAWSRRVVFGLLARTRHRLIVLLALLRALLTLCLDLTLATRTRTASQRQASPRLPLTGWTLKSLLTGLQ
jgi:hypothetical protein